MTFVDEESLGTIVVFIDHARTEIQIDLVTVVLYGDVKRWIAPHAHISDRILEKQIDAQNVGLSEPVDVRTYLTLLATVSKVSHFPRDVVRTYTEDLCVENFRNF